MSCISSEPKTDILDGNGISTPLNNDEIEVITLIKIMRSKHTFACSVFHSIKCCEKEDGLQLSILLHEHKQKVI